jgi:glutamate receptor, anionic
MYNHLSRSISLTLSCPMNLKLYPLDRQTCSLLMISCKLHRRMPLVHFIDFSIFLPMTTDGWTTDDLIFQWKRENPVQVAKNMHLPRFMLEKYEADFCNSVTNTGNGYVTNDRANRWRRPIHRPNYISSIYRMMITFY